MTTTTLSVPTHESGMETLTSDLVERYLQWSVGAMRRAQTALADARDAEVNAKHVYEAAHRRALLDPERPRVERGGFTTAERDAWVGQKCETEEIDYDLAEVFRKAAEEHCKTLEKSSIVAMFLGKSLLAERGATR